MKALRGLLRGLQTTNDTNQILHGRYSRSLEPTPYDVIIKINSLTALQTSGWEIVLGQSVDSVTQETNEPEDIYGVVVSVLGSFNRGKSFLLNQLCGIRLRHGNLVRTEGISITAGREQASNLIFIDTAGTDTAIPRNKLDDNKATEALLKEIALYLSSYIIIVVNRLRATDQSYIKQVLKHSGGKKNIMIVHNLMDVETIADVQEVIKQEIEGIYEAQPGTMALQVDPNTKTINFFTSLHNCSGANDNDVGNNANNDVKMHHFIFAKTDSEAAKIWNRQSIVGIMTMLQTATVYRRKLDVITEMIRYVNNKLPQILIFDKEQDMTPEDDSSPLAEIQHHVSKPYIVLTERRELKDLDQNPCRLKVSSKLVYDDAGYLIGVNSIDNGRWEPRYSKFETSDALHIVIELAGFTEDDIEPELFEDIIIINGRRAEFSSIFPNATSLYEKIPIGEFILKIRLDHKVNPDKAEMKCIEGLYEITCPKKIVIGRKLKMKK